MIDHRFFDDKYDTKTDIDNEYLTIAIILNRPIDCVDLFLKVIKASDIVILIDGAANEVMNFCKQHNQTIPVDYITGDFDSILESTKAYFQSLNQGKSDS